MREFGYETVDVFTNQPLAGNPLAVFSDGRGIAADEMQRIATEFNYSEITFVLPPADQANSAQVRIFTPKSELPFAGHPNVGTAFVLGRRGEILGRPVGETMRFEEGAGLVEVKLQRDGEAVVGASFKVPRAIELGREVAEVASPDALKRARPNSAAFSEALARYREPPDRFPVFIYARKSDSTERLQARMFAPLSNIIEDPATGSASAALGGLLATIDHARDADMQISIAQGVEMGRPSAIEVTARKQGGVVREIFVSGRCVPMMRGTLAMP